MLTAATVPATPPAPAAGSSVCRWDNLWAEETQLAEILLVLQAAPELSPADLSQACHPSALASASAEAPALDCREGTQSLGLRPGGRCLVRLGSRVRALLRQRDPRPPSHAEVLALLGEGAGVRSAPPRATSSDP